MKTYALKRIKEIFPHFNEREITEADFWKACKKFRIIVHSIPLLVDGYHERRCSRNYILINNALKGRKWLHTAFHEFCHFLFDAPAGDENYVWFRGKDMPRNSAIARRERWADAFATICLLPFPELVRLSLEDEFPDDTDLLKLCADRTRVYTNYGI